MRHLQNLVSRSFACVKGLCAIKFPKSPILDELLHWLANACLPLKKVVFSECYNFSFVGNLEVVNVLNDGSMIDLFEYLFRLKSINLDLCSKLTNSTFFTLKRECPVLSEIRMKSTNLGVEEFTTDDEFMKKVAFICLNLQLLDVSDCRIITEEGIGEILKSCGEIQCLRIEQCRHINSFRIKHFEVKKLVVLQVGASRIDNDALITIANTCPWLLYLNLSSVENCRALREILFYFCRNVDTNILSGIVF
ncbi:hypothetical protein ACOSQ4_009921 [Xanthoceras sorbifolium]